MMSEFRDFLTTKAETFRRLALCQKRQGQHFPAHLKLAPQDKCEGVGDNFSENKMKSVPENYLIKEFINTFCAHF